MGFIQFHKPSPVVIPGGFMAGMQKGPHLVRFCESSMGSSWSSKASAWILEPASAGKCPAKNGGFNGNIMRNSKENLGKSTINEGFNGRRIHGGCSIATFDYERVYTSQFMFNRLHIEYYISYRYIPYYHWCCDIYLYNTIWIYSIYIIHEY